MPLALVAGVVVSTPLPASASDPLTFVGTIGFPRLASPEGVAVASNGDVYVTDRNKIGSTTTSLGSDRLVKYDADGHLLDVLAGPGPGSGNIPTGVVADPSGIAIAPSGAVYVLERYSNSDNRVQEFDSTGNFVTWWGGYTPGANPPTTEQRGSLGSGNGEFSHPQAITVDSLGNVYVADTGNKRVQAFTSSGGWVSSWCSDGAAPVSGVCSSPQPTGIAIDGSDIVYVVASGMVRRFTTSGSFLSSWSVPGASGVAIDGSDNVWLAVGSVVKEYDNLGASLLGTYGSGALTGGAVALSVAPGGKIYVADNGNTGNNGGSGYIQRFASDGTPEIEWGKYPGAGVPDYPSGVAVDTDDNVFITKAATDEIQKFDKDGALLDEFGGTGNAAGFLIDPAALAISSDGFVYVTDTGNQRIQKFDTSGNYITQWGSAGTGDGFVADPAGIAVAPGGNVYVADTNNNRIQEFTAGGVFVRKWGVFGTADGNLKAPKGIAIDGSGHVWVADSGNKRVEEFSATGTFIAVWGASGTGDGGLANPSDLAFDPEGTVWVADQGHNRIQRFSTSGSFLAKLGGLADGLGTQEFDGPTGIAVDSTGRVLVSDTNNHRVEVFEDKNGPDTTIGGPGVATPSSSASLTMTANEPGATFHCKIDGESSYAPCISPKNYSGLAEGSHTFYAYATDSLGFDGNPTAYTWAVDTTPPIANISAKPTNPTASTTANFSFTSNEPGPAIGPHFYCAKDGTTYSLCDSPKSYSNLSAGGHVFHVKAIDAAGNVGAAASYSWTIDLTKPTIVIDQAPSGYVQSTDATIKFHSGDSTATFDCKFDGATTYSPCASPMTFSLLGAGLHSFYVEATDDLGNVSSPAHVTWTVDTQTHRPDNQIATGTTYVGNDIYNSTGTNQTKTLKAKVGKTVTFKIRIENDGSGTDPLTVTGTGSGKGYSVTYFSGTTNITSKVVAGTYRLTLNVGQSVVLKMTVKVGSNAVTSRSMLVKTSADHQTARLDAVKAVVKRA